VSGDDLSVVYSVHEEVPVSGSFWGAGSLGQQDFRSRKVQGMKCRGSGYVYIYEAAKSSLL
jgi:hypothetical protein